MSNMLRRKPVRTSVIVLDFDGVLVADSDAVFKRDAYRAVLAPYGQCESLLEEASTRFGSGRAGGRKEVFYYVLKKLGVPASVLGARVEETTRAFDEYVQTKIREAGLVPGAREALTDLTQRGMVLYLNSGTATPALVTSTRNLSVDRFFRGILGSTPEPIGGSKAENFYYIEKKELVAADKILFVGDSESDVAAAEEVGCRFLGISNQWNAWRDATRTFPVIMNLEEIAKFL